MSIRAKAVRTLYRAKRIDLNGVKQAVIEGIVTEAEYKLITGEEYTA